MKATMTIPPGDRPARWLFRGRHRRIITEQRATPDVPLQLVRTHHEQGMPTPPSPDIVLAVLTAGHFAGHFDFGAGRFAATGTVPGAITLSPPDTTCQYNVEGGGDLLVLAFPHRHLLDALEPLVPRPSSDLGLLHATAFYDPIVETLCWQLWHNAAADCDPLYGETALTTLLSVLCHRAGRPVPGVGPRSRLSAAALRRTLDYMNDRHAEGITLDELATVAGVSRFHFAKLFQRTTGLPPHHFLIRLRLARALPLIRANKESLASIAGAVGFNDQPHLTRRCRQVLGQTPAALR